LKGQKEHFPKKAEIIGFLITFFLNHTNPPLREGHKRLCLNFLELELGWHGSDVTITKKVPKWALKANLHSLTAYLHNSL
jgi:hypothetical protein